MLSKSLIQNLLKNSLESGYLNKFNFAMKQKVIQLEKDIGN